MGNYLEKSNQKDDDDDIKFKPSADKVYDTNKIYWDVDGNLRYGSSEKNRDEEVLELLQLDNPDESDHEKLWMIIPSRWVRKWLLFAHIKCGPEPGEIDMESLLVRDTKYELDSWDTTAIAYGWRPKATLLPPSMGMMEKDNFPGHYRRVSLDVWKRLVTTYGIKGYPIAVRGIPFDEKSRWRVFKTTEDIDINKCPAPVIAESKEEKEKPEEKKTLLGTLGLKNTIFGSSASKDKELPKKSLIKSP